jgi:hypothetical protein
MAALRAAPRLHPLHDTFARRACALLERALPGLAEPERLLTDQGYTSLRGWPRFERLMAGLPAGRRYASVRQPAMARSAVSLHGLTPEQQLARWRALAAEGRRPAALSVAVQEDGTTTAASLWHAPLVDEAQRVALARRQGAAAALLWRLGEREVVWPRLRHSPTPDVRSYLLARLAGRGGRPAAGAGGRCLRPPRPGPGAGRVRRGRAAQGAARRRDAAALAVV